VSLYIVRPDHDVAEILAALADAYVLGREPEELAGLTFLDTFDWRLFHRGMALTVVRRGSRVSLGLQQHGEMLPELRIRRKPAFSKEIPAGPLRDAVLPVAGIRRLLPRCTLKIERRVAAVFTDDTRAVARLRLTSGVAAPPGSRRFHPIPTTLEVLTLKGYADEAESLKRYLVETLGLRPVKKGLMALALETFGEAPGTDPSDPKLELQQGMSAAEGARAIHKALLSVILSNQDGVVRDLDPEFLHDFRVAIRRTRVALGQLRGVFPPRDVDHFLREFKWLGDRTGPTRDMDVYLLKIPQYQEALPAAVRDELGPMVHYLERKKKTVHLRLTRTLASKRYRDFMEQWGSFLNREEASAPAPPHAMEPLIFLASRRIWTLYRKVLARGREAVADAPPEALHRLRIKCKQLRYLITFFRTLYPGEELLAILKPLKALQEALGNFNDLHVQQLALQRLAEEMLEAGAAPPETLMAMGRLMGWLEAQSKVERARFSARFAAFSQPETVMRFESLFHPA